MTHFEIELVAVARALGWPGLGEGKGADMLAPWVALGWMREQVERYQRLKGAIRAASLEVIGAERAGENITDPHWCLGWLASAAGQLHVEARDADET